MVVGCVVREVLFKWNSIWIMHGIFCTGFAVSGFQLGFELTVAATF